MVKFTDRRGKTKTSRLYVPISTHLSRETIIQIQFHYKAADGTLTFSPEFNLPSFVPGNPFNNLNPENPFVVAAAIENRQSSLVLVPKTALSLVEF